MGLGRLGSWRRGRLDLRFDLERKPVEEDRTVFQRPAARSMRPGARLNNVYEIERLVAQGGMGEVYRGFNIQTGDPVAIKMIRPEFSNDPEILDLFRREASILHSFTHDAIVRYFVFSVDPQLRARLSCDGVCGRAVAQEAAGFRTASSRGGQNPAKARRVRAGGRARAWRRASRHFPRQSDHAGRRRSQRQGYRFRHRSRAARGRSDNPRRRVRRQAELRVARNSWASRAPTSPPSRISTVSVLSWPRRCSAGPSTWRGRKRR